MRTDKQTDAPVERYIFTQEELERLEKQLELTGDREELIGWLDNYSYFLPDWLIIINEAVHEMIAKKQKLGLPFDKEQDMLRDVSFLFSKIAFFNGMIADWHKELQLGKKLTEEMIQNGHP